jgi:hypothetical protein
MDVEDGGMQIDDDEEHYNASPSNPRKRAHSPTDDADANPDASRTPKRLRRLAVRTASLPSASTAIHSRRAERLARRKRERAAAALHRAGMEIDGSQ